MLEGSRARAVSAYKVNEEDKLSSFPLILRTGKMRFILFLPFLCKYMPNNITACSKMQPIFGHNKSFKFRYLVEQVTKW